MIELICAYEECNNKFIPVTHNQKYCSESCCRVATNLKIKERYYRNKERLNGKKRYCSNKGCNNLLSRYNSDTVCQTCSARNVSIHRKTLIDRVSCVSGEVKVS